MDDEELIKMKMQQNLQNQLIQTNVQEAQMKQAEEILRQTASKILDRKAYERLTNLKLVKPDIAIQLEVYLAQLYQAGQIHSVITEQQFIEILKAFTSKRDFTIKRK